MAKRSLVRMADNYMRRVKRNPPESVGERVDGLCVEIKSDGTAISSWGEIEWLQALERLGVNDGELASTMEDVASWGVDD